MTRLVPTLSDRRNTVSEKLIEGALPAVICSACWSRAPKLLLHRRSAAPTCSLQTRASPRALHLGAGDRRCHGVLWWLFLVCAVSLPWGSPLALAVAHSRRAPSFLGVGTRLLFFYSLLVSLSGPWEGGEPCASITDVAGHFSSLSRKDTRAPMSLHLKTLTISLPLGLQERGTGSFLSIPTPTPHTPTPHALR